MSWEFLKGASWKGGRAEKGDIVDDLPQSTKAIYLEQGVIREADPEPDIHIDLEKEEE